MKTDTDVVKTQSSPQTTTAVTISNDIVINKIINGPLTGEITTIIQK